MQFWEVTPELGDVRTVQSYAAHTDLGGALSQHTWMGRSGFRPNPDGSYLVVKGIGPGPGSEWMRAFIDRNSYRSYHGAGGCLRLGTGTPFPLLVPFGQGERAWRVHTARPEGMSRFSLCLLEAEAACLYREISVPVALPLSVSRVHYPTPWEAGSHTSMGEFLAARMPEAVRSHLRLAGKAAPDVFQIGRQVYVELDAGVLARRVLSPFRIANLYQATLDEDRESLTGLFHHMSCVLDAAGVTEVGNALLKRLARTAGTLFCEGVIHGQLHIHFQDITLAGELADLDCTTFLRSLPDSIEDIPFGASTAGTAYRRHRARLQQLGSSFGVRLVEDADLRYNARFIGSKASDGWRHLQIATALLRQLFDLYNQAALAVDRLGRLEGGPLNWEELSRLRHLFTQEVATEIRRHRGRTLFHWCLQHGWERLLDVDLCPLNKRTLYGWASAGVPPDFVNSPGDAIRARFVRAEAESFFTALSTHIEQQVPA